MDMDGDKIYGRKQIFDICSWQRQACQKDIGAV